MIKLKRVLESSAKNRLKKRVDTHNKLQNRKASDRYVEYISKEFKDRPKDLLYLFQSVRHTAKHYKKYKGMFQYKLTEILSDIIYTHAEAVGEVHPSFDRELKKLEKQCFVKDQHPIEFFALAAEVFELYGGLKFYS
jgi:hypothetical protein